MNPMDAMAGLLEWAGKNIAYNLDYIPDDKLNWKPEPGAKSALEIIQHTAGAMMSLQPLLTGGGFVPNEPPLPADREAAKQLIVAASGAYAEGMRHVNPELLGGSVDFPWGPMPFPQAASLAVLDSVHHHGQIAYIQTLLGDNEDHFDPEAM